jgi:hypothetical protein
VLFTSNFGDFYELFSFYPKPAVEVVAFGFVDLMNN